MLKTERDEKGMINQSYFKNSEIMTFEKLSTPFYYYDLALLHKTLVKLIEAANKHNYMVHYAIKANANDRILNLIKSFGLGVDCVSGNEILKAINSGFETKKIVFAGVGKTDQEIRIALKNNIFCMNCESIQEVFIIDRIAKEMGIIASIAFRINPNIDACSHPYITTGINITKFGLSMEDVKWLLNKKKFLSNIHLIGIHFHIGSQITELSIFKDLCKKANDILKWFTENNLKIDHINMGGGLGVDYENPANNLSDFFSFFAVFKKTLKVCPEQQVHFELGRSIVAPCGILITKVLYIKKGLNKNFIIVDAGFTELIRPSLYQSYHKIENLNSVFPKKIYDIVGPICETTDCFGKSLNFPKTKRGDLLAIYTTGAYGETMSSHYNLRDAIKSYYSDMFVEY